MSAYVAFYKGRPRPGAPLRERIKYLFDGTIRLLTRSPYSHCELAIPDTARPGVYFCVSASVRDGGVRAKTMPLSADKWVLIPLPDSINEHGQLDRLYRNTVSQPYDWFGAVGVVFKTRQRGDKWFCSEWCAAALGLPDGWRWSPNDLAAIVPALKRQT